MAGPLTGLKVLDLSRVLAGPWCAQIFADMGAEVIKIERPGSGDDTRHWGPPWLKDRDGMETSQSSYYLSANRGKKSVAIDIGKPAGRDIIRDMAARCDILVENFKTGGLAAKGLGYEELSVINPGLIYCSITGFGHSGPMAEEPGYDYLIQAQAGLMSITGVPDGMPGAGPQRVGLAVSDLTSGMNAAIAILAALHHRDKTGEGQHIDIALLDVQVSWLANQALNYFCGDKVPTRTGEYHPNLAPYQPFTTSDGKIIIAVGNDPQFIRLCEAIGCPHIAKDDRYTTNPRRVANREGLVDELAKRTSEFSDQELLSRLRAVQVPCGIIQSIDQVFRDPQVLSRGMKLDLAHPQIGNVPGVANPTKYSKTPIEYEKAPPLLGEDTDLVLREFLQKSDEDIDALKKDGVL
jgi:crotonobetainyl-CoA:carnitine CoA-transferase CaiB-like acyl-CoA transferase